MSNSNNSNRGGKTLNNAASNLGVLSVNITNIKRYIAHILPFRPTVPPSLPNGPILDDHNKLSTGCFNICRLDLDLVFVLVNYEKKLFQ